MRKLKPFPNPETDFHSEPDTDREPAWITTLGCILLAIIFCLGLIAV